MDKLTAIKIKYDDGTYSDEIPVSVLSENVEWDNTHTLVDVLGSIDVDITGTIQDQISQLFNEKVSNSDMQAYVTNSMPAYITSWLNTNVNPVGSAVVVDSSLTVSGAAADAKVVGDKVADLDDLKSAVSTLDTIIAPPVMASRTIDNTATIITNTSSKVNIAAKEGDTLVVNVSGTAFTKSTCFLYFFYGESATATKAGSVTIGQDTSIVLTDDINALSIYANNLVEGTIIITASDTPDGLYSDVDDLKKSNADMLDDIGTLTSTVESTESLLYMSSSVYAQYEQGGISTFTGNPVSNIFATWVRTPDFISVDALLSIYKPSTVKIVLLFYDSSYQYLNDYISVTSASAMTWTKQDIIDDHPNAKYIKICGSLRSSDTTSPADYVNSGSYARYIITLQEIIDESRAESGVQAIPGYYTTYMENKANRINQLAKSCAGTGDVFAFITDEHWKNYNAKNSPALINYLYHNCHINRVFDGGDTDNYGNELYCNALRVAFPGKIYHITGNHEWFDPTDGNDLYYMMDMYNNDQIGNPLEHYYYVDNHQQKIRYIILNAFIREDGSATVTTGYSTDQLHWLTNTALNVNDGWDIIVLTHWIGSNLSGGVQEITNVRNALDAYNSASQSGKILAIIQGHGHYDAVFHTQGGIPVILTTCDKNLPWIDSGVDKEPWITQYRQAGTTSEQAFDVYILDRVSNTISAIRVGAMAMDNYAPSHDTTNFSPDGVLDERIVHYEKVSASSAVTLTPSITGTIAWKSADETIATVENGVVTPAGTGTVTISVTNDNYQAEIWTIVV